MINVSTSFWVRAAPKSWWKYTTSMYKWKGKEGERQRERERGAHKCLRRERKDKDRFTDWIQR